MIYQHVARGADQAITSAIDAHVETERSKDDDDARWFASLAVLVSVCRNREGTGGSGPGGRPPRRV